ncbi:AIPR family protein [Methanolobus psychrotolerans]|uniref:AIPR family protein n=1 Tax=Methanolobus psychrotolerans TaxID=1874706 RepID=UPI000B91C818|nr:AIPR family protein [Methanolobus psychrotolerans]
MANKDLFISSYLEKISGKFGINEDQAFEIFSIAAMLDKTFDEVFDDVIINQYSEKNGVPDGGIDGVYFNEQDGFYVMEVFQCKNSKSLKQNELEKFRQDFIEVFEKGRRDKPNTQNLMPKLDEYISITQKGYIIEHRLNFLFNGSIEDKKYAANKDMFRSYHDPRNKFLIYDSDELYRKIETLIKTDKRRNEVKFTFRAQKSNISPKEPQAIISYSILNIKAVNFRMEALQLCELVDEEIRVNGVEDKLFAENIRGFLGYTNKTNRKIQQTLNTESESIYFPFLNNGITILCNEMQIPSNPQAGDYIIPTYNPVIVNGLQTSKILYDTYKKDKERIKDIYVTIRLYETKNQDLVDKITEATNTQSAINFRDKISTKDFQKYVKVLFENKGIGYLSKRGETFTNELSKTMQESITSEKAIKFWYATYYEKPEVAKNSISSVLEEVFDAVNEENPLAKLFDGSKDSPVYEQIYNAYLIMRTVSENKKKQDVKEDYINHCDELLSYGIYKRLSSNKSKINLENIDIIYDAVSKIIKKIVSNEKKKREENNSTYSHSSYFKSAQSRIDYNREANITETYDLVDKLLNNDLSTIG